MNKFVVVVFSDQTKAYEGLHALAELHREGSVTVYGTVVAERDTKGELAIKQRSDEGPLGLGVGALAGALIGLFGGPVGAAVGFAAGSVAGSWRDFVHAEVSDEFVQDVQRDLVPGKFAVIAEVSEDWIAPLDARMEALGGKIVREGRKDFIDDLIQKRVDAVKAELAERKAERTRSKAERMESKLADEIEHARQKVERTADKARARLDETKQEMEAKVRALEEQAAKAKPEVGDRIRQRIAELRTGFGEREKKLRKAYDLTQEVLHS